MAADLQALRGKDRKEASQPRTRNGVRMTVDFNHGLVGRSVVYRERHEGAKPEDGVITAVNVEADIAFVRYKMGITSQATNASDLTFQDGEPVVLAEART